MMPAQRKETLESGNPILDKNLECIKHYNPTLVKALLDLPFLTNDIQLIETNKAEPNLSYNGLPLHEQNGAENEAKEIFQKSENNISNINIVFGIGIGHLFDEVCKNALGPVILYEPNLEILRVTLELVDLSKEFSHKKIKVASNEQELEAAFNSIWKYKSRIDIMFLNSYQNIYATEIEAIIKKLELINAGAACEANLISSVGFKFFSTVLSNLHYSLGATPLKELKDIYKGKTALVVSAGPTLDSNIETIKKNRDKFVIFCVGQALKALTKNEISPDFLNIEEIADGSGQTLGVDLSEINLILGPSTNESIYKLKVKQKFLFPASTTRAGRYWSRITGVDISGYAMKGTVSTQALYSAKMLGCKKIILVGQDLAFLNNSCYSDGAAHSDLVFEQNSTTQKYEFRIKDYKNYAKHILNIEEDIAEEEYKKLAEDRVRTTNERLCFVKGISGDEIPTQIDYATYISLFTEFTYDNKDLELINTSMIGAQIDGFKNMPLEQALEGAEPFERLSFSTKFKYDKKIILENLEEEKKYYEKMLNSFGPTKECFFKIDRALKRSNAITKDVYKYYNILSELYNYACDEYYNKNEFFQCLVGRDGYELNHYITTTADTGDTQLNKSYTLLKNYFKNLEKLPKMLNEIENQKELLAKSFISL